MGWNRHIGNRIMTLFSFWQHWVILNDQSSIDYSLFAKPFLHYFPSIYWWSSIYPRKSSLHAKFNVKDLGEARYFMGMEIHITAQGSYLSQHKYISDILKDIDMLNCKPARFPLPTRLKLRSNAGILLQDSYKYRRLVER